MPLMTVTMAAEALGLKRRTVLAHIERGNLKAESAGAFLLMRESDVKRFMENRRKPGRPRKRKLKPKAE